MWLSDFADFFALKQNLISVKMSLEFLIPQQNQKILKYRSHPADLRPSKDIDRKLAVQAKRLKAYFFDTKAENFKKSVWNFNVWANKK